VKLSSWLTLLYLSRGGRGWSVSAWLHGGLLVLQCTASCRSSRHSSSPFGRRWSLRFKRHPTLPTTAGTYMLTSELWISTTAYRFTRSGFSVLRNWRLVSKQGTHQAWNKVTRATRTRRFSEAWDFSEATWKYHYFLIKFIKTYAPFDPYWRTERAMPKTAASHRVDTHAHAGLTRVQSWTPKYVRHLSCTLNTSDLRTAFSCADWYAAEHSPADGWFVASVAGWLRICLQLISVDLTRRCTWAGSRRYAHGRDTVAHVSKEVHGLMVIHAWPRGWRPLGSDDNDGGRYKWRNIRALATWLSTCNHPWQPGKSRIRVSECFSHQRVKYLASWLLSCEKKGSEWSAPIKFGAYQKESS
jgi:hypothetical protein